VGSCSVVKKGKKARKAVEREFHTPIIRTIKGGDFWGGGVYPGVQLQKMTEVMGGNYQL